MLNPKMMLVPVEIVVITNPVPAKNNAPRAHGLV